METKPVSAEWVWSKESNVHLTNDINWFETFTNFSTTAIYKQKGKAPSILNVSCIGTVHVPVQRCRRQNGPASLNIWVLENVLYVPDFPFNVVGGPLPGYTAKYDGKFVTRRTRGYVLDENGETFACFLPKPDTGLPVFCLHAGHRPLAKVDLLQKCFSEKDKKNRPDRVVAREFCVTWSDKEWNRWEAREPAAQAQQAPEVPAKAEVKAPVAQTVTQPPAPQALFSRDELDFVRRAWGDPSTFMGCYGLTWNDSAHRKMAQETVRALMQEGQAATVTVAGAESSAPAIKTKPKARSLAKPPKGVASSSTVTTALSDTTNAPKILRQASSDLLILDY